MPFLTIAGENKLAQNQSVSGGLNIVSFVLANVPNLGAEPADRIAALPDPSLIVDTLPFTKRGYVNPNQVVYSLVMGSNVGDYDFNWIGLVDDDGVLVAVSHIPTIQKRKNVGGIPGNTITRNFLLKYTGVQEITATTVPVETWQIDFSDRLNGIDERERLANLDVYGHEGFLDDGWKVTGSAGTYSVAAGIGYVGGIRAKNATAQEITTATFPNEIWLNVSLQGDISDMTAVCEFVIDTGPFPDYVDGNGITHYLTKIADIDAAGEVVEARVISYLKDIKSIVDKSATGKKLFDVSGDENDIVLTSKAGTTKITELNNYDEFSFIVGATNTSLVTIKIDDLAAVPLAGVVSDTQIFETALIAVRYIAGSFFIANQINPKTGNPVALIGEIISSPFAGIGACKMRFDSGELSRATHPILFAKAQKTGLIDQALKDADLKEYGGKWGDGDGATTFTVPIYDGAFLRMMGDALGNDIGRELGTWQGDAMQNITGSASINYTGSLFDGAFSVQRIGTGSAVNQGSMYGTLTLDASRVVRTADETRSMNYAVYAEFLA